jgi:hypothetical protein
VNNLAGEKPADPSGCDDDGIHIFQSEVDAMGLFLSPGSDE